MRFGATNAFLSFPAPVAKRDTPTISRQSIINPTSNPFAASVYVPTGASAQR